MNDGGIVNGWLSHIQQVATKALSGNDVADEMRQVVSEAVGQISGWKSGSTSEENLNALTGQVKLASHVNHASQPKRKEALDLAHDLLSQAISQRSG
jgi:uncharacterized membrane protein YhfC